MHLYIRVYIAIHHDSHYIYIVTIYIVTIYSDYIYSDYIYIVAVVVCIYIYIYMVYIYICVCLCEYMGLFLYRCPLPALPSGVSNLITPLAPSSLKYLALCK